MNLCCCFTSALQSYCHGIPSGFFSSFVFAFHALILSMAFTATRWNLPIITGIKTLKTISATTQKNRHYPSAKLDTFKFFSLNYNKSHFSKSIQFWTTRLKNRCPTFIQWTIEFHQNHPSNHMHPPNSKSPKVLELCLLSVGWEKANESKCYTYSNTHLCRSYNLTRS